MGGTTPEIPIMRHLSMLLLACLASLLSAGEAAFAKENAAYHAAGTAVIDMVNGGTIDAAKVTALVLEMQKAVLPAAKAYAKKHAAGAKAIDKTIAAAMIVDAAGTAVTGLGAMKDLSFDEIAKQWHDLGIFTVAEVGIDMAAEANEHYCDPLHSIVHPIMVLRAAIDQAAKADPENLKRMKEEMTEGLEQMEKLVTALH